MHQPFRNLKNVAWQWTLGGRGRAIRGKYWESISACKALHIDVHIRHTEQLFGRASGKFRVSRRRLTIAISKDCGKEQAQAAGN